MSNAIRYDPLLVHYLAGELSERLRGRVTSAAPLFAPDLSVTLPLNGSELLRVDLHPARGWIRILPFASGDAATELDAICTQVDAPDDERLLRFDLHETGRFQSRSRTLVLELHTNQWNAILLGEDGRIVNALRPRRAGDRALFPGERYVPPEHRPRYGVGSVDRAEALEFWMDRLGRAAAADRRRTLLREFAWTGSANADWILGDAGADDEGLAAAFERWWWLSRLPPPEPQVLISARGASPYPVPLEGLESEPAASLLDAMARVAESAPTPSVDPRLARAAALVRARVAAVERRIGSLEHELESGDDVEALRGTGDLLLARLHLVPRGSARVELPGWDGEPLEVELDPALSPSENATRYYERASRRKRADQKIPELIEAAEAELSRLRDAEARLDRGELPEWLAELLERGDAPRAGREIDAPAAPYRLYRTSGGLEVRVGRNARDNDRLTFQESAPNDVWLHARSVPGSHVILRWADPDAAPPARDLEEAAQIAAVFSRARTSGTVPVDWTRRKYVRKPRGAAPGAVVPQQVRTIFVEPDEAAVEAMAEQRV